MRSERITGGAGGESRPDAGQVGGRYIVPGGGVCVGCGDMGRLARTWGTFCIRRLRVRKLLREEFDERTVAPPTWEGTTVRLNVL